MEEMSLDRHLWPAQAINGISDDGIASESKMHSDLVGATRKWATLKLGKVPSSAFFSIRPR
jgi:hypothetical protein